jgi:Domain of unknown function DUF11
MIVADPGSRGAASPSSRRRHPSLGLRFGGHAGAVSGGATVPLGGRSKPLEYRFVSLRYPRPLAGSLAVAVLIGAALALPAAAFASGAADLTVALTSNPAAPKPGGRVSYRIEVRNRGPATAAKVQIDFITSAALSSPTAWVSTGRCLRSPLEVACLFGTLRPGTVARATISGVMPKDLRPGTLVHNSVTVASDTALVNPGNAVAHADYTTPGGKPSAAPPSPAASPSGTAPLAQPARPGRAISLLWIVLPLVGFAAAVLALVLRVRSRRRPAPASPYQNAWPH